MQVVLVLLLAVTLCAGQTTDNRSWTRIKNESATTPTTLISAIEGISIIPDNTTTSNSTTSNTRGVGTLPGDANYTLELRMTIVLIGFFIAMSCLIAIIFVCELLKNEDNGGPNETMVELTGIGNASSHENGESSDHDDEVVNMDVVQTSDAAENAGHGTTPGESEEGNGGKAAGGKDKNETDGGGDEKPSSSTLSLEYLDEITKVESKLTCTHQVQGETPAADSGELEQDLGQLDHKDNIIQNAHHRLAGLHYSRRVKRTKLACLFNHKNRPTTVIPDKMATW